MMRVVVTGANGFIGKNLAVALKNLVEAIEVIEITREDSIISTRQKLLGCGVIYHLAGVNRPLETSEFEQINHGFTTELLEIIKELGIKPKFIFASSTQAIADNPYGLSKKNAEEEVSNFATQYPIEAVIYRLPNVFGKWCKPNYNSGVATFCYNIDRNIPVIINDPNAKVNLVYIDDVVGQLLAHLNTSLNEGTHQCEVLPVYSTTVGELVQIIKSFKSNRLNLVSPEVGNDLVKKLYSTYLSYLPTSGLSYNLTLREDNRGTLFELIKNDKFGQIFISTTKPGITRGNHYHHTKVEKFCVIKGQAAIKLRHVLETQVIEYVVNGDMPSVIDIPPGYAHSITNIAETELVTLFWANEIFDQNKPDTYFLDV